MRRRGGMALPAEAPTASYAPCSRRVPCGTGRFQPHRMERRPTTPATQSAPALDRGGAMEYFIMSMPSFPPNGADLTREEALTMIIASIAMEELALSHIINAEGEKLQYILGALPGAKPCACPQDVLAVNKSVATLLDVVAQNQMLLKSKLEKVLDACPSPLPPCGQRPCPPPYQPPYQPPCGPAPCPPSCGPGGCPPVCPPPGKPNGGAKSALHLAEQQAGLLWRPGCRMPWRQSARRGERVCWSKQNPTQIRLDPQAAYAVRCTLAVRAMPPAQGEGMIYLRQTPCGAFADTQPLQFSLERIGCSPETLQYTAVLHPRMGVAGQAELSLVLDTKNALCVERATMDVVEL